MGPRLAQMWAYSPEGVDRKGGKIPACWRTRHGNVIIGAVAALGEHDEHGPCWEISTINPLGYGYSEKMHASNVRKALVECESKLVDLGWLAVNNQWVAREGK